MGQKGGGDFVSQIMMIISELLVLVGNLIAYAVEKVNEAIFQEGWEKRAKELGHWIEVVGPWLIALLLLWAISSCCGCCGNSKKASKMMKAPGRNYRMRRDAFESDPRSYFRDLRE